MSLVDTICSVTSYCAQESLDLVSAVLTLAGALGGAKSNSTPEAEAEQPAAAESIWAYYTNALLNCWFLIVLLAVVHFLILVAVRRPKKLEELKEIGHRVIQLWFLAVFKNFLLKLLRRNRR